MFLCWLDRNTENMFCISSSKFCDEKQKKENNNCDSGSLLVLPLRQHLVLVLCIFFELFSKYQYTVHWTQITLDEYTPKWCGYLVSVLIAKWNDQKKKIFHVSVDSKCTYTRDGKRKGETECRTEESTEEGTETEIKGNISYAHLFCLLKSWTGFMNIFSSRYQCKSNRKN